MKQTQPPNVQLDVSPERPVQSADVGASIRPRKKRVREDQTIKQQVKQHLDKMSNDLRY